MLRSIGSAIATTNRGPLVAPSRLIRCIRKSANMANDGDSWLSGIGVNVSGVLDTIKETASAFFDPNAAKSEASAAGPAPSAATDAAPPPPAPAPAPASPTPTPAGAQPPADDPDVPSLEERYLTAVSKPDWPLAAKVLNECSQEEIQIRVGKLTDEQKLELHDGALKIIGLNSKVAQMTSAVATEVLDKKFNAAVTARKWDLAAEYLNGFSVEDIQRRLDPKLMKELYGGAVENPRVGPNSNVAKLTESAGRTSGSADKPTIAVAASGDNFKVTGWGFLPNSTVTIRGRQLGADWAKELPYFTARADGSGSFGSDVAGIEVCKAVGAIRFSATDGRENRADISRKLWSDDVEATCLVQAQEGPEPEEPETKIQAGLRTVYSEKVRYWVYDAGLKPPKLVVDGERFGKGVVIRAEFVSTHGGRGYAIYKRDSDPSGDFPGYGMMEPRGTTVSQDEVTDMQF